MSDTELLLRAMKGDREAFATMVHKHQARLRGFTARYVDDSDDVYDLVQDAFLNAFQHLGDFDASRDFEHWMRGICRNLIRNYYRSRSVRRKAAQTLIDNALIERLDLPETRRDPSDKIEALRQCLTELEPGHRNLLQWRYHADETLQSIAKRMSRSEPAVAMLLLRLRSLLRNCVERRIAEGGA